jgi:hypothetical protein
MKPTDAARASLLPWLAPALAVLVAVTMRCASYLHDDVSWLITMAEGVLAGKKPYVDLIETNPPAAFLIYTPQVALAARLGITSELAVTLSMFLSALASTLVVGSILRDAGAIKKSMAPYLAALSLMILLVFCGDIFAQREHFAIIAILPLLACYTARALERTPSIPVLLLCGVSAGLTLAIKPYFILAVGLPLLYVVWRSSKTWSNILRTIFGLESLTMGLGVLIYLGAIWTLLPAYFETIVPIFLAIYTPVRVSPGMMLLHASTWAVVGSGILALVLLRRRLTQPLCAVFLLAALGFAIAYCVQAKGWPYQAYPAVALFLFAAGFGLIEDFIPNLLSRPPSGHTTVIVGLGISLVLFTALDLRWAKLPLAYPPYLSTLKEIAPQNAKVISIAKDMAGPQATRLIGGRWVGASPYQFIAIYANQAIATQKDLSPEAIKRLAGYAAFDEAMLVGQIRKEKPDIVLIMHPDMKKWAFKQPKVAAALADYQKAASVGVVEIWKRR